MRTHIDIKKMINNKDLSTKVYIYMSTKEAGDDFDPYESNYTYANLNPLAIKAIVRELTPETAFWKNYGLFISGTKELLTEKKYRTAFENANKVVIDSIEYQTFKGGPGNRTLITERPFNTIRVVLTRAG